jgi:flagellar basal-body rod protein FlgB
MYFNEINTCVIQGNRGFYSGGDMMSSDASTFQLLQNALLATNMRQQVYASNIANAQTPGYKRQDVQFETMLQNAMSAPEAYPGERTIPIPSPNQANWQSIAQIQPVLVTDNQTTVGNDGNNVDIDSEMANLAENQIRYNTLVQDVQVRLTQMKNAINGG